MPSTEGGSTGSTEGYWEWKEAPKQEEPEEPQHKKVSWSQMCGNADIPTGLNYQNYWWHENWKAKGLSYFMVYQSVKVKKEADVEEHTLFLMGHIYLPWPIWTPDRVVASLKEVYPKIDFFAEEF